MVIRYRTAHCNINSSLLMDLHKIIVGSSLCPKLIILRPFDELQLGSGTKGNQIPHSHFTSVHIIPTDIEMSRSAMLKEAATRNLSLAANL